MKIIKLLLLFLLTAGCKSAKKLPSAHKEIVKESVREIQNSRSFNLNYDLAWHRVVEWFAEQNIQIDKMEITSGQMSARYMLKTDSRYLDCGQTDKENKKDRVYPDPDRLGSLKITLKNESQNSTLSLNVFFNSRLSVYQ